MVKHRNQQHVIVGNCGQAAVEAIFSVLIILLLFLASGQILYTTMISAEAVKRAHKNAIEYFREINKTKGNELYTTLELIEGEVEVSADSAYARVIKGWTLFHKDYPPYQKPDTKFGPGTTYKSVRGLMVAAGPLKGPVPDDYVNEKGEGRSAFGVPKGSKPYPDADGQGLNDSGEALRRDELYNLCIKLNIENECNYFK